MQLAPSTLIGRHRPCREPWPLAGPLRVCLALVALIGTHAVGGCFSRGGFLPARLIFTEDADLTFGTRPVGVDEGLSVALHNVGGSDAAELVIEPLAPPLFLDRSACADRLGGGQGCVIRVRFAPTVAGDFSTTLAVQYRDEAGPRRVTLPLRAIAVDAAWLTTDVADAVDFGVLRPNEQADRPIVFTNVGSVTAQVATLVDPPPPFSFAGGLPPGLGGDCTTSLAPGASCTLVLRFSSAIAGTFAATSTVDYDTGATQESLTLTLDGTAVTATFAGWSELRAVGATVPVPWSGLAATNAEVRLDWEPMIVTPPLPIDDYAVFRSTSPGGQTFATPLATVPAGATPSYVDSVPAAAGTAYYVVRPRVAGLILAASAADAELAVPAPPDNMVLVHRWFANRELCGLMGRAIDRGQHYRCDYNGPGHDGTEHLDLGYSLFVDAYETGCNVTPPPGCGDSLNGCAGVVAPYGVVSGNAGEVYLNRAQNRCFVNTSATSGTAWTEVGDTFLSLEDRAAASAHAPGLPPLVLIDQAGAWDLCGSRSIAGAGKVRLPSRREQILFAAWPAGLDVATVTEIETGDALPTSGACNTNYGDGVVYEDTLWPVDLDTLPHSAASGRRALRTGNTYTNNCVSRYGVHDAVGNLWEWTSDTVRSCDPRQHACWAAASAVDPRNDDWAGYSLDGTVAPGAQGAELTDWAIGSAAHGATHFAVPLGLPVLPALASTYDALPLGTAVGDLDPTRLSGDHIFVSTGAVNGVPARGGAGGGSWFDGDMAGRFAVDLRSRTQSLFFDQGLRCVAPIEPVLAPPPSFTVTFHGWRNVVAQGARLPVPQSGLPPTSARVTLAWEPMTVSPTHRFVGYEIFRAEAPGAQDFGAPLATALSTATRTFTDTSVVAETTYYYVVRPMLSGASTEAAADLEIEVFVPPTGMSLVHRWIGNADMCGLLESPIDRAADYRCAYSGMGGNGVHFDLGEHLLFDTVEMGCNYTPAPACGGGGCLGVVPPGGAVAGNRDDVYYDRLLGNCFINTSAVSGTTWTDANSPLSAPQYRTIASNRPGLPPLVWITRNQAWAACTAMPAGSLGGKRLPSRQEHIVASAWEPSHSDPIIAGLENGTNLPVTGACNSNGGSGLVFDDTPDEPADLETLPFTNAAGWRMVRTGSFATRRCVSRFGLQDVISNVWEWDTDEVVCSTTTHACLGQTSSIDPSNDQWAAYRFDGTLGPGGTVAGQGPPNYTDAWNFNLTTYDATRFLPALGLPLVSTATGQGVGIGVGPGEFLPARFHDDVIWLSTENDSTRTVLSGGMASDQWRVGRWSVTMQLPVTYFAVWAGLRCARSLP